MGKKFYVCQGFQTWNSYQRPGVIHWQGQRYPCIYSTFLFDYGLSYRGFDSAFWVHISLRTTHDKVWTERGFSCKIMLAKINNRPEWYWVRPLSCTNGRLSVTCHESLHKGTRSTNRLINLRSLGNSQLVSWSLITWSLISSKFFLKKLTFL